MYDLTNDDPDMFKNMWETTLDDEDFQDQSDPDIIKQYTKIFYNINWISNILRIKKIQNIKKMQK